MYNFSNFNQDLEQIIDTSNDYKDLLNRGVKIMKKLISNQELFNQEWLDKLMNGEIDCTVYRSDKNKFVVQVFTWSSGSSTPVHDHETWGLMGIYRNSLRVAEYSYHNKNIGITQEYVAQKGDICYFPPDEDIHQIENDTNNVSISIHVYGKNIDEYNIYDLENNQVLRQGI